MSKIPIRREEITDEWLSKRLANLGSCSISNLDFEILTGHNAALSQLFRIRISYSTCTSDHPEVLIAKIPPADDAVRLREASLGPYVRELGSYRVLEPYQGISIPKLYSSDEDRCEQTACFLFEDIGPIRGGQKYVAVDFDVAKSSVEFMADFHARFWKDDLLPERAWIRGANWAHLFDQDPLVASAGWKVIREDDRIDKAGGAVVAGEYLGPRLFDLMKAMGSRPNTLTHNDFHQGNLLLRATGANQIPVIIDWQLTAYAGATNDLAKFMMTTVPFEIFAEYELALVRHYVSRLQALEVVGYSFDECFRDYRRAQVMVFGNYAISSVERSSDGRQTYPLGELIGDSTRRVVKALSLVDPNEFSAVLP